jgi:hypothetical protein
LSLQCFVVVQGLKLPPFEANVYYRRPTDTPELLAPHLKVNWLCGVKRGHQLWHVAGDAF